MGFPAGKKADFLDSVVGEMGPSDSGDDKYGASMKEEGDDDGSMDSDPEEAQQDRIMAAKMIGKAIGAPPGFDASKLADALAAFVKAC